jgi:TFIIF-interacting CTD phosphatase-like protein
MLQLDPENFCSYKLFREHCTFYNNAFVKDLTQLGRSMKDVIIVDNSPVAYLFQPENAMPAVSWYDDPND